MKTFKQFIYEMFKITKVPYGVSRQTLQMEADQMEDEEDFALFKYIASDSSAKQDISTNFDELLERYSNRRDITVYRGLHFAEKEEYDKFIKSINHSSNITITEISSWSENKADAESYAKTPLRFNASSFKEKLERKQKEESEAISGYRGVLIKTSIKKGTAIDTNRFIMKYDSLSVSPEIILDSGTFKIEIEREIKTFKDRIKDKEIDVNKTLNDYLDKILNNHDFDEQVDETVKLFTYITKNYKNAISDTRKKQLEKLLNDLMITAEEDVKRANEMLINAKDVYNNNDMEYKFTLVPYQFQILDSATQKILEKFTDTRVLYLTVYRYLPQYKIFNLIYRMEPLGIFSSEYMKSLNEKIKRLINLFISGINEFKRKNKNYIVISDIKSLLLNLNNNDKMEMISKVSTKSDYKKLNDYVDEIEKHLPYNPAGRFPYIVDIYRRFDENTKI